MDITWDIESNNLLNRETIDYTASPYKLKPSFSMHCIVVEEHATGKLIAFYDGPTYIFDGREYAEQDAELGYTYELKDYVAINYEHKQLDEFKPYIESNPLDKVVAHNSINFDHLAVKLYYGMDYTVGPDTWCGKPVEIIDTMVLSKTLNPDRFGGHSLDKLSEKVGLRKIDFRPYCKDEHRFVRFAADMLYYCIRDVQVNTRVYRWLLEEKGDWPWDDAVTLEKAVAELITRQEHRGFKFNRELAEANIEELDRFMEERKAKIEPILPKKKATKGFMDDFTPPVKQILKNGQPTSYITKFAEKVGAEIVGEVTSFKLLFEGNEYPLPLALEPLVTEQVATINDTTHIKEWLVGSFNWNPSEYKERDLSVNSKKIKLSMDKRTEAIEKYVEQTLNSPFCSDRCEFLETTPAKLKSKLLGYKEGRAIKVLTNPSFTRGQEKEICPDLLRISADFPYARDIVEYLTFKHRRNSILGGGLEWDEEEEAEKGYMAYIREDGRIPTPADTCGAATSRMKHRVCANIPRVTSLYGEKMRGLFGVDSDSVQIGYDFDSLEARIESHYCVPMNTQILTKQGWKDYYTLSEGDVVLGYNATTKQKEWTKVTGKVFYKDADTVKVTAGRQSYVTTPDHRWYVEQRDTRAKVYNPTVLTTKELNTGTKIIVNAPFNTEQDTMSACSGIAQGKYSGLWSERVLSMSHNERVAFLEGFLIADGYYHEHKQKPVWRWAQNDGELFEAALLASYLVHDGNVTVADNDGKQKVKVVTLCRNGRITGQRMIKEDAGSQDVWCPQTELGSWVMRQGNCITITGNCWKYDPDKEYCHSLTQDKPNDVHTKMAQRISEIIGREFARSPAKNVKYGCLPTDSTLVLTPSGWKNGRDIQVGDVVMGYNNKTKQNEWTSVLATYLYENADVKTFGNNHWVVEATPDHRWYGSKLKQYRSKKKAIKVIEDAVFTAEEIKQTHYILNTAPFAGGNRSVLPHQAALVGWILSDGYYKWSERSEATSASGGKRKGIVGSIAQASHKFQAELIGVISANGMNYKEGIVGNRSNKYEVTSYRLESKDLRDFFDSVVGCRKQKHDVDWCSWVLSLTREALEAFVHAFWLADGDSKGREQDTFMTFKQLRGNIADALVLAGYLLGYNVTQRGGRISNIRFQKKRVHTTTQEFRTYAERNTQVFCLTTELDTFIIKQNGIITITGNCTYGSAPPKVAKTIGSDLATGKIVFDAFWLAAFPLANLKDNLQKYWETVGGKKFILGIDKRKVPTRSAHAILNSLFQSGGVICAKRAMIIHDRKLRAEGLAVDFFKDDWKSMLFANQLIAYHDEAQLEVRKELVKWRVGKSKEEVVELKEELEKETNLQWSDVGHIGDKWYIGYCRVGELAVESVLEAGRYYNLNVDLTAGYMLGKDWASCH